MEKNFKVFKDVLKQDEQILKVLKPKQKTFIWAPWLLWGIFFLAVILICVVALIPAREIAPLVFVVGALLLMFVITIIVLSVAYEKCFYAITNQRVIIRSGIIGVDYKTMYYTDATAVETNVSLLDKMVGANTGTITMASASRPVYVASKNGWGGSFHLSAVENPYDLAKEIQNYVDEAKQKNKKEDNSNSKSNSIVDEIAKLDNLKQNGAITQEEYDELKKNLIKNLNN